MTQQAPAHQQTSAIISISSHESTAGKYGGLISYSLAKALRVHLVELFSYIRTNVPTFAGIHAVVTLLRILQFVGPSILAPFQRIWNRSTESYTLVSFISVLFHILPPGFRQSYGQYYLYAYSGLMFLYFLATMVSSSQYQHKAYVSRWMLVLLTYFHATLGHILTPIAIQFSFEGIGDVIMGNSSSITRDIILVVAVVIFASTQLWIGMYVSNQSLSFKYDSMMSVISFAQSQFSNASLLITAVLAIACKLDRIAQITLLFVSSAIYFCSLLIPFAKGGFVFPWTSQALISASISSGICCFIGGIFIAINYQPTLVSLVIAILFHPIFYTITVIATSRIINSRIHILDLILDDNSNFEQISSPNYFLNICVSGFRVGHPLCIDWTIFRIAVEKWSKNSDIWLMFAKFVAVYPEEMQTLLWIFKTVVNSKIKGISAQCIKHETISISRLREANLSPDLKEKLTSLHRELQHTKNRLSRIWDVAIQGNIGEVESSVKTFLKDKEENEAMIERLVRQFPNNRFVTRSFSSFLREIEADRQKAQDIQDKASRLQRGIQINDDNIHHLGCQSFPLIPDQIHTAAPQINAQPDTTTQSEANSSFLDEAFAGDTDQKMNVDSDAISAAIKKLRIPAINSTIITRIFVLLICIFFPVIFLYCYVQVDEESLMEPINYLSIISRIRTINVQCLAFSNRLILQGINMSAATIATSNSSFSSFNGSWDIHVQESYALDLLTTYLQKLELFSNYETSDSDVSESQQLLFGSSTYFSDYLNAENFTLTMTSIPAVLSDYFVQHSKFVNANYTFNSSVINSSALINPLANSYNASFIINDAMDALSAYVESTATKTQNVSYYILIAYCVFITVVLVLETVLQIRLLTYHKEAAYRCLTNLPKNTISALSENLRAIMKKKESESTSTQQSDSEYNRRDENIVKIMNNGMVARTGYTDMMLFGLSSFMVLAATVVGSVLLFLYVKNITDGINTNAPILDDIDGAYAATLRAIVFGNSIAMISQGLTPPVYAGFNLDPQFERALSRRVMFWQNVDLDFKSVRTSAKQSYYCSNSLAIPTSIRGALECEDVDIIYETVGDMLQDIYAPYSQDKTPIDPMDEKIGLMYDLMTFPLYDLLFMKVINEAIPSIESQISSDQMKLCPYVIVCIIIAGVFEILIIFQMNSIDSYIRSVLRLLLHCNPSVIFQSPKVMKVLGGEFESTHADVATHTREYYDQVYNSLVDAVLYADSNYKIISCNVSCGRVFGTEPNELTGKNLSDFLKSGAFNGQVNKLLDFSNSVSVKAVYTPPNGTKSDILFSSAVHDQKVIISATDITNTERYQTLIEEERIKVEKLLSSIIPKSLVGKVMSGEKNISFAVQSASIIFIDIVEFTPWCGSMPAARVMQTLNGFFSRLDSLLPKYNTITRIKGIGDCYMAAGGIFSEINQPAEHAKEAVSFGLDAIDEIENLDSELQEHLRIRVGINTGGPIVAGVLGTSKPTFEIFGPAINMAQQMEHTGVPMNVQISRPVYELVYGESFSIKERGVVEVKGGQVLTYLVTRKMQTVVPPAPSIAPVVVAPVAKS